MGKTKDEKRAERKARREERMRREQEWAAQAEAARWTDRDGTARPTPERRTKGAFALHLTEDAGVRVAVDEAATELDRLHRADVITAEQCQGGHDFAALMERTRLVSAGRSCIDFSPVGFGDGGNEWQEERDNRDRQELYLACGMLTWAELRRVCHEGQPPRNVGRLREGLELCAKFWG